MLIDVQHVLLLVAFFRRPNYWRRLPLSCVSSQVAAADTDGADQESWKECRLLVLSTRDTTPPEAKASVGRAFQEVEVWFARCEGLR